MKGVVAAGHEVTAQAAASILRAGGNAFDAVLAALAASCVPEVVLSSLGGGGFLMAHRADSGETLLYDFFAQTPLHKRPQSDIDFHAIHADFGPATQEFHIGAGSTATPGVIPGLFAINKGLGSLPLMAIFEPAMRAARDGVTVSPFNAYLFTVIEPILTASPETRALFTRDGALLKAADTYHNPDFADTLETLAKEGEQFYREGELGQLIARQSIEHGGHLQLEDLSTYKVERRMPLQKSYRDRRFYLNPAPSAGGPLIGFSLGLLEHKCPRTIPGPLDLIDVMQTTNMARGACACPLEDFATETHIAQHLQQAAGHQQSTRGTTHISVIDEAGNAAALTVSNGEGNGRIVDGTGIMLNNMLGEEDLHDHGFHSWNENSRLSSMMSPTLIESSSGALVALGSGGSNRIRSAVLQVASNLVDQGCSLETAVAAPRLHLEKCGTVSFETSPDCAPLTPEVQAALLRSYPDARPWPDPNMFFGGVHTVTRSAEGTLEGAGDSRRGGVVIKVAGQAAG